MSYAAIRLIHVGDGWTMGDVLWVAKQENTVLVSSNGHDKTSLCDVIPVTARLTVGRAYTFLDINQKFQDTSGVYVMSPY